MNRIFCLMALVIFLSGCRIDAAVVGEGRVASLSGSIDCSTGNVGDCTEKYLTSGAETFLAEPAPGWTFSSWKNCSYTGLQQCRTVFDQSLAGISGSWRITAIFHPINPPVQEASYTYNSLGQRITKSVGAETTVFQYDLDGNLIAELDSAGQPLRQHIYLNNQPIAQVSKRGTDVAVHYVHTDHLGTPALLTDQSRIVVGDFEVTPFGETFSDYTEVDYYKRFPGQYKDMETGLHYNYFRDYDPSLGRYIQSDPVGLWAGPNTYAYAGGNPLMYVDPYGLAWFRPSDHPYTVGRDGNSAFGNPGYSPVRPGEGIGKFIDNYIPAGHTFGSMHDRYVEDTTRKGWSDWLVNIPSMPVVYLLAFRREYVRSLSKLFGEEFYQHDVHDDFPSDSCNK